jgi:hypothetical protein
MPAVVLPATIAAAKPSASGGSSAPAALSTKRTKSAELDSGHMSAGSVNDQRVLGKISKDLKATLFE